MSHLTRRDFLYQSAATAAGLALAACQPIQPPMPEPETLAPLPLVEPVEVNLLEPDRVDKIEKTIKYLMNSARVPGLGVGIVRGGEVVYAKGFGVTTVGTEQPVTTQVIFRVMDSTHIFTATAAMQLVEQGKLDLDAPVVDVLPYFKLADDRYKEITTRHLLTETAGLPPTPEDRPALDWEGKTRQTDDGALERYVRSLGDTPLDTRYGLGEQYVFCNMAFDIAGAVIAQASGEVFEEYMAQHILRPLGMASSTFYPEEVDPTNMAAPHVTEGQLGNAMVSDLVTHSRERAPSVGLFSNVADLNRWIQVNLNRGELDGVRILQDARFDELWAPTEERGTGASIVAKRSLGWYAGDSSGRPVISYWGGDVGFHASCDLHPDTNSGAVVLGNLYTGWGITSPYASTIETTILDIASK